MDCSPESYHQRLAEGEAAIGRIRAAQRRGEYGTEAINTDFAIVYQLIDQRVRFTVSHSGWKSGLDHEELVQDVAAKLWEHLCSPTYTSIERYLGVYLKHAIWRSQRRATRLQRDCHVDDLDRADPQAETAITELVDRVLLQEAAEYLPVSEWCALTLALDGYANNEIAYKLQVSPATATRLRSRAAKRLRQLLDSVPVPPQTNVTLYRPDVE